jgi:hypothetical protein
MNISLCNYKNLIGEPNKGLRKYRILDIPILDTTVTIIGIYLISFYFKVSIYEVLIIVVLLMIISHNLFCVRSIDQKILFPE